MTTTPDEKPATEPNLPVLSRGEARAIQAFAWPDIWAEDLRLEVDSHSFGLVGREYERDILRDESQNIVVPKGAQLGLTTVFIVKSAHYIIKRGWHCLYLLPLKAGSVQFVQGRIDPIIDSNKTLSAEFKRVDNRNQKATVKGVKWYIRGTNIHSELREIPADFLILDERDVANEAHMGDAYARLQGSEIQRSYELSTPTVDGHGVYSDDGYPASDQMQWWVPCPHCGSKQVLTFEDNVLPHLGDTLEECQDSCRCIHCGGVFTDEQRAAANAEGTWVPLNPDRELRGYHLSQLNSPTAKLAMPKFGILVNWFKGQTDSGKLKDFYTLGLGLPYTAPGDKFTAELLRQQCGNYSIGGGFLSTSGYYIGIDQGQNVLHVTIWIKDGLNFRLVRAEMIRADGDLTKWKVLERDILTSYSNWVAVCDAHPDSEDCEALSKRYPGRFWMGYEKDRPDQHETCKFMPAKYGEPAKVNINRTMAFDSYIKGFIDRRHWLPREGGDLGEHMPGKAYNGFFFQHLQMVRVLQADASDRLVARWVNGKVDPKQTGKTVKQGNRPDHWHHSGMFAWAASQQSTPLVITSQVGSVLKAAGGLVTSGRRR